MRNLCFFVAFLAVVPALARSDDREEAGQSAEISGHLEEACQYYVAALQALPEPPPPEADMRLRELITRVASRLSSPLAVPESAQQHYLKAQSLLAAHNTLGDAADTGGLELAATEFAKAVRAAPWWPDAVFGLASAQQKLKRYEEAAANLRLYRLAVPAPSLDPVRSVPAIPAVNGAAIVYVYWPSQHSGGGTPNRLGCDSKTVAKLQRGRFVVLKLQPGRHILDFGREVSEDFQTGREYYLRAHVKPWGSIKDLQFVTKEQATAAMQTEKMTVGDADHLFDLECRAGS